MDLSLNFTLAEATVSELAERLGISNEPPIHIIPVMENTAKNMEAVRVLLNAPILVSSWYRSLRLNRALRSPDISQHVRGEAVDFIAPKFGTPTEVVKQLFKYRAVLDFDQLILEHSWVHISFLSNPAAQPRLQMLSLLANGQYAVGITNKLGVPV